MGETPVSRPEGTIQRSLQTLSASGVLSFPALTEVVG